MLYEKYTSDVRLPVSVHKKTYHHQLLAGISIARQYN